MIICGQCGNFIEQDMGFCSECGAAVTIPVGVPPTGGENPYTTAPPITPPQLRNVPPQTHPMPLGQPAPAPVKARKIIAGLVVVGVIGIVGVVVVYFAVFSFSARNTILAQVKAGNLVKPQGNSGYDLFLKHRTGDLSQNDIAEINRQAAPLLQKRGDQILQNLRIEQAESEDEWTESARIYSWLNELQPNKAFEARIYFSQARLALIKKNYDGAISDFGRVVELVPQGDAATAPALNSIGRAYLAKKDKADAQTFYQRATVAEPGWLWPWINLGAVAIDDDVRDYTTAEKALTHAIQLNYEKASSHIYLGMTYEKTNRLCAALSEYRIALNSATNNPTPTANIDTINKRISAIESRGISCGA